MPTSAQVSAQAGSAALSFAGSEIYDAIMAGIEPELVSANVGTLAEKYKNETDDEAAIRADRYNRAFEAYQGALDAQQKAWAQQVAVMRKQALQSTEKQSREAEVADLDAIAQTIAAQ